MFLRSLVGTDHPPKQVMPIASACVELEKKDLGFGVLPGSGK